MASEVDCAASVARGKQGLVVSLALAVVVVFFYCSLRVQEPHGAKSMTSPRIIPPTSSLPIQSPTILVIAKDQKDFHGIDGCNISAISGQHYNKDVTQRSGSVVGLGGWLVDKLGETVPDKAWIVLAGVGSIPSYQIPIMFHEKRPDVQEALGGGSDFAYAGFIVNINTTGLSTGEYHMYIVFDHDGTYYTCDNGRRLLVSDDDESTP
ncbi:MAG TPA: hypothetical protein VIL60_09460 [Rhodanobacter sp.]